MSRHPRPIHPSVAAHENGFLRSAFNQAWFQLPVLLMACVAVSSALIVSAIAAAASPLAGLVAAALTIAPTLMALVSLSCGLAVENSMSWRDFLAELRRLYWVSVLLAVVPMAVALLTLLAYTAWRQAGEAWLLAPIGIGATASVLALVGSIVALPLRTLYDTPHGALIWLTALHLFARLPVPFLGSVALAGLGIWAALNWSNGLFLLVPAPFSLGLAVAFRIVESRFLDPAGTINGAWISR